MAYLTTGLDLKRDALGMAGEPGDGTSQYDADVYEWLTVIQRTLVSGGQLGNSLLQPMDWPWARAYPRGSILLQTPYHGDFDPAQQVAPATGSRDVPVNGAPPLPDLRFYRFVCEDFETRPIIQRVDNTIGYILLQDPWAGDDLTLTDTEFWYAYPDTYELPTDFVRGCSPFFVHGSSTPIEVVTPEQLEREYPAASAPRGIPRLAALVQDRRVRFSHFLPSTSLGAVSDNPVLLEFDYIARPDVIAEGSIPVVPVEHRRVLSYGAAFLILDDKDDSSAGQLWERFQAQYRALCDEYTRGLHAMAPSRWGALPPPRAIPQWYDLRNQYLW